MSHQPVASMTNFARSRHSCSNSPASSPTSPHASMLSYRIRRLERRIAHLVARHPNDLALIEKLVDTLSRKIA